MLSLIQAIAIRIAWRTGISASAFPVAVGQTRPGRQSTGRHLAIDFFSPAVFVTIEGQIT
jgi:hypothetical protein